MSKLRRFAMRFGRYECPNCGNTNDDKFEQKPNGDVLCDECKTRVKRT